MNLSILWDLGGALSFEVLKMARGRFSSKVNTAVALCANKIPNCFPIIIMTPIEGFGQKFQFITGKP